MRPAAAVWTLLTVLAAGLQAQDVQPKATITRIESLPGQKVRVSVSIQDQKGDPLSDLNAVDLKIFEDGREVAKETLSQGWSVSAVLVIDLSGSMSGPKLEGAKRAALRYVEIARAGYQLALIGFDEQPTIRRDFTTDKALLQAGVEELRIRSPHAHTAINDAVAKATEILRTRPGRRAVLVLTDGIDNASQRSQAAVVEEAKSAEVTVSTIGLGADARPAFLKQFNDTGGRYLEASDVDQLEGLFEKQVQLLAREYQVEFTSSQLADGGRRNITAEVELRPAAGATTSGSAQQRYVAPQFIPAVRGKLTWYSLLIAGLLILPAIVGIGMDVKVIRSMRVQCVSTLPGNSKLIGALDSNGIRFSAGEPVIYCPRCRKPHHVRSWRLQHCHCAYDNAGSPFCYHRRLPAWLRRALDRVTRGHSSSCGRSWLCCCAGDGDGY